jgi:hypothetical protein
MGRAQFSSQANRAALVEAMSSVAGEARFRVGGGCEEAETTSQAENGSGSVSTRNGDATRSRSCPKPATE